MKIIRAALLAAVATAGIAGTAEAQTKKYFAREVLAPGPTKTADTDTDTGTTTPPKDVVYNIDQSTSNRKTLNVNGCSFSNDAISNGFATINDAINWCKRVKVKYPSIQPGRMYCTTVLLNDNKFQASMFSAQCNATFSGGDNWPASTGQGHWSFTADSAAYAANP